MGALALKPLGRGRRAHLNVATYRGIVRQRVGKLARLFDALKIDSSAIETDREVKRLLRIGLRNEII